ncbi:MAG: hypothetical protein IK015_03110 [Treponema sp.]|nr:hypothetical protein [Treponema sp.]
MKIIEKIALGVCALALCGGVFFSCSNAASSGSGLTGGTGSTDSAGTGTGNGTGSGAATIQYTEVWSGSKTMAWSGDENCVVIDHAKFTADFNSLRITYAATAGAIKIAACDPWTELKPDSVNAGSIGDDGAVNLETSVQTVTVALSAANVALIKGQEKSGAWGGLKIFGADTVTVTKVESFKAASSGTEQTQTTNGGEQQTQNGGQTQTQSGGEQAQTQTPASGNVVLLENAEGWTEDWTTKTFEAAKFANAVTGSKIKFTVRKNTDQYVTDNEDGSKNYSQCYSIIQLLDGENKLVSGTITGGVIEAAAGNLKPNYLLANGDPDYDESHVFTMVYTPSDAEINILKTKGVGIQAHGTRILKIEFVPTAE